MKKILFATLLSTTVVVVCAQQHLTVGVGGGINNVSPSLKTEGYLGNGYNLDADVFVPFLQRRTFALGVIVGGAYINNENLKPEAHTLQDEYRLFSGKLDVASKVKGKESDGFRGQVGLQSDFSFGALLLSPSVSAGYFGQTQQGFSHTATLTEKDGTVYPLTLADLPEVKRTGFLTIPQVKISYPIAGAWRIYTAMRMNIGPEMTIEQRQLEPTGGFNERKTYELQQLRTGQMVAMPVVRTKYQTWAVNVGVGWTLGRQKKNQGTAERLSMTPTTTRHIQGQTFGEKVNQGLQRPGQPMGGIVVKGGKNPGGNLMTITVNENGEFALNGLEKGSYKFILSFPEKAEAQDFNTTRNNREGSGKHQVSTGDFNTTRSNREGSGKHQVSTGDFNTTRSNREGSGKHQVSTDDFNTTRSNRERGQDLVVHTDTPIAGVVVKGGKSPHGSMTSLMVGDDGTIQFDVLEPGDYKFMIIQAPEPTSQGIENNKKEKVKDRPAHGLKDTLKTNV